MNPQLSPEECAACLEILYRGLVQIRNLSAAGDSARAEAIADALHNLPHLLRTGPQRGWDVATFRNLFLEPLIERYPDLAWLTQPLDELT
ncbi:hypothetical protein [Labilithrix luteola]|uniref:hypothetical protein n=1 Tax=Labilithrix luteola TaxID=1391654 RepID=UPI0011BADF6D|nr:hypothetical protein [Labilithrix luteola]